MAVGDHPDDGVVHLFRFRMRSPLVIGAGWMIGAAGPFDGDGIRGRRVRLCSPCRCIRRGRRRPRRALDALRLTPSGCARRGRDLNPADPGSVALRPWLLQVSSQPMQRAAAARTNGAAMTPTGCSPTRSPTGAGAGPTPTDLRRRCPRRWSTRCSDARLTGDMLEDMGAVTSSRRSGRWSTPTPTGTIATATAWSPVSRSWRRGCGGRDGRGPARLLGAMVDPTSATTTSTATSGPCLAVRLRRAQPAAPTRPSTGTLGLTSREPGGAHRGGDRRTPRAT